MTWTLTKRYGDDLAAAFPAVDIGRAARQAHVWVMANLPKRKTAEGMPDFVRRWIAKDQNRGGTPRPPVMPAGPNRTFYT